MDLNTIVRLKDGRLGIITSGQYYGEYGISNFWYGRIIDEHGNATDEKFHGYNNGQYWKIVKDNFKVNINIKTK
jgi:hypothetical protein